VRAPGGHGDGDTMATPVSTRRVTLDAAQETVAAARRRKAYTAGAFDMSTDALAPLCQPGQPLFGITASPDDDRRFAQRAAKKSCRRRDHDRQGLFACFGRKAVWEVR
jgi:hypothetical protein